tara:strand:- start:2895 stop:3500 length:606 start_codon:yes stop_codon:yes gene_type:complete
MALRAGYGTGPYNVARYGYPQVYESSVADSSAASVTVSGSYVFQVSASTTATSAGTSRLVRRRLGYGTGPYSEARYGYPEIWEGSSAVSVTSSVTQADYERIQNSAVADSSTSSTSMVGVRVRLGDIADTSTATGTAQAFLAIVGAAAGASTASVAINYVRIRPFAASDTSDTDVGTFARYKWIEQINASETWTESDYRGD